jgi:DNA sulfur modification protein DndE
MFSNIRTTKANKEIVARLTSKLSLGTENVIARISLTYSIAADRKLDLSHIGDSLGKEYSFKVLFGDYSDYYIALVAVHYQLYKTDKDIPKYIKMHIDDGLQLINLDIENKYSLSGTDFLINEIEKGLQFI